MSTDNLANTLPVYDEINNCWRVTIDGRVEEGDLEYVASEFGKTGLIYPFNYRNNKPEGWDDHEHTFDGVLRYVFDYPDTFSIAGYEEYYSKQQRKMIDDIIQRIQSLKNV